MLRVEQPAQAGAGVEQQQARARARQRSRWSLVPRGASSPSCRAASRPCVLTFVLAGLPTSVYFSGRRYNVVGRRPASGAPWRPGRPVWIPQATSRWPISRWAKSPGTSGSPLSRISAQALAGDETAFLDALESAGRGAGLTQKVPIDRPARRVQPWERGRSARGCSRAAATSAESAARRSCALEHVALTRIAAGYSGGLGETIERLRRMAEESSPLDVDSGAIKPGEFGDRLSLEVERCQRMDLPLGLLRAGRRQRRGGAARGRQASARRPARDRRLPAREPAALRQRRPHRRRRLRARAARTSAGAGSPGPRSVCVARSASCGGHGEPPELTFALAHYDFVDVNAQEMLAGCSGAALRSRARGASRAASRGRDRQSVTGRPSASAARRTISRSLG